MKNGERIRLPSGKYKARKVDTDRLERQGATRFYGARHGRIFQTPNLERAGSPERIDHRSNAERGIDELAHATWAWRPVKWRRKA